MDKPLWVWVLFISIVIISLVVDLGIFNKENKEINLKDSLYLSSFYILIACLFGGWIWYYLGATSSKEYFTGFLIEKTLALDNIFVISIIFTFFQVPREYQRRVLFWGILGVIVLRAIMIGFGTYIVNEFGWIMHFFAAFLIFTGIKMVVIKENQIDLRNNIIFKFCRKYMKLTNEFHGEKFFIFLEKNNSKMLYATPLFLTLCLIEFADLIFAVDSVPAIFAITRDPYIVYTSNIFAILGLRALYFALAAIIYRFKYLKYSVAIILILVGLKIYVAEFYGKIPEAISLLITLLVLLAGVIFSLYKTKSQKM